MVHADLDRQLMILADDTVGSLAEILNPVSAAGINISALCAYAINNMVAVMLVTDDNNAAKRILEKQGHKVREEEIILLSVDNKPGFLQGVLDKIAEAGIDLTLIYGGSDRSSSISRNVLISRNNLDVMMLIKTQLERS